MNIALYPCIIVGSSFTFQFKLYFNKWLEWKKKWKERWQETKELRIFKAKTGQNGRHVLREKLRVSSLARATKGEMHLSLLSRWFATFTFLPKISHAFHSPAEHSDSMDIETWKELCRDIPDHQILCIYFFSHLCSSGASFKTQRHHLSSRWGGGFSDSHSGSKTGLISAAVSGDKKNKGRGKGLCLWNNTTSFYLATFNCQSHTFLTIIN